MNIWTFLQLCCCIEKCTLLHLVVCAYIYTCTCVLYVTVFMCCCMYICSQDEKARLKCRAITFAGKFEPVSRSCRAPLASGKLCPRKDRLKVN